LTALKEQLMNIIFKESDPSDIWEEPLKEHELKNCGGFDIEIFPKNATTIDEVESFILKEEIKGTITYKYRKK
jgi:hypothetical protein